MNRSEIVQRAVDDTGRLLRAIAAGLRDAVWIVLPIAIRLACIGSVVFAAAWALEPMQRALGGDVVALVPTAALILAAPAFVLMAGLSWGGLLLAAGAIVIMGAVLPMLPPVIVSLVMAGVLAATMLQTFRRMTK